MTRRVAELVSAAVMVVAPAVVVVAAAVGARAAASPAGQGEGYLLPLIVSQPLLVSTVLTVNLVIWQQQAGRWINEV